MQNYSSKNFDIILSDHVERSFHPQKKECAMDREMLGCHKLRKRHHHVKCREKYLVAHQSPFWFGHENSRSRLNRPSTEAQEPCKLRYGTNDRLSSKKLKS